VAATAYGAYLPWALMSHRHQQDWQAVANVVIQAHEAQRWQAIESAPKDGTEVLLWVDYSRTQIMTGSYSFGSWFPTDGDKPICGLPTHWSPIPAPPQEVK
jgi:hypothetical protein